MTDLQSEVARRPVFDCYPPLVDIEFAMTVALERVAEWDYARDPHGWCHERPILLTLMAEVERLRAERDEWQSAHQAEVGF